LIIFIRRNTGIRSIPNDEILIEHFQEIYGSRFVVFESASFKEQQELFAQATVIFGPHGAGLSNMILANAPCSVIEFPLEPNCNRTFEYMANVLGFQYKTFQPLHSYYRGIFNPVDTKIVEQLQLEIDAMLCKS
jgi:capsular polysaccharide biosynthesis protein